MALPPTLLSSALILSVSRDEAAGRDSQAQALVSVLCIADYTLSEMPTQ